MYRLDNKTAIITGGAKGIGKEIALLFARQGATVQLLDLDQNAGEATVREIHHKNGKAFYSHCDVAKDSDVSASFSELIAMGLLPDIVVNNAGIGLVGTLENTTPEDLNKLIDVNIKGIYHLLKLCLPEMKQKGGVVLNMASVAATCGIAERFAYSMTKGAVVAMTLSIAKDYMEFGIRCNCISPGRVHTGFVDEYLRKNYPGREKEMYEQLAKTQPIGRMGTPSEIASLALYLCSDEAGFITGCDYPIDGGFTRLNS